MPRSGYIATRVNPELLASVDAVLETIGLSRSEAINLFFTQITLHHGLPFSLKIPNAETQAAMEDARLGRNLTEFSSIEALLADASLMDDE